MATAKNKTEEKVLTVEERVDLYTIGVKRLQEQYQIGLVPTLKVTQQGIIPQVQFVDLAKKEDTEAPEEKSDAKDEK